MAVVLGIGLAVVYMPRTFRSREQEAIGLLRDLRDDWGLPLAGSAIVEEYEDVRIRNGGGPYYR